MPSAAGDTPLLVAGRLTKKDTLDEELTVEENLWVYGRYFGLSWAHVRQRARELLDEPTKHYLDEAEQRPARRPRPGTHRRARLPPRWRGSRAAIRPFPIQPLRLITAGLADLVSAAAGRPPRYLPVVGPPGSRAMMTAPEAEPGYRAIAPPDWDDRVAARIALALPVYRPGRQAARLSCPLLLGAADADQTTPPRVGNRVAGRARHVELCHYANGHFGVFAEPLRSKVVADQLGFLRRHLDLV